MLSRARRRRRAPQSLASPHEPKTPFRHRAWLASPLVVDAARDRAMTAYPDKPITMIVPFPPGGVADTVARPVAEALGRELKQTVVVENRAGAGGALGIGVASRAPADGYTVLLSLSSISILPEADKILERKPAYQLSQFKPIARFTADPTVLVVRADAPWKNVRRLRRRRASAIPASTTTAARATTGRCTCRWRCSRPQAGFRMTHIPYTGAGPAVVALLGGQVDAIASGPSTIVQQIQAGKLRALAHWGDAAAVGAARRAEPEAARLSGSHSRSGRRCSSRPARPRR